METPPRVRGNDWSVLPRLAPGTWTPSMSVTVVIPAYRAEHTLPYTLAALAAQTYPQNLMEVVVVNDDPGSHLHLPEIRPEHTTVVETESSWGRANACHEGVIAAGGDVIHWLDADMVPSREELELQMRWHHVSDHVVVLGHKVFVDDADLPDVAAVHSAVRAGTLAELFADRWTGEHEWVEEIWRRTSDLRTVGFRGFHVHVGSSASLPRSLYHEAGGLDTSLKLGEDIELGYRLQMKGTVFVADRQATSWHLGRSTLMRNERSVQYYNAPFIAERVPDLRKFRLHHGRMYRVPLIEVVVDAENETHEEVKHSVDGVLQGRPGDIRVLLRGPWSALDDDRRSPLEDPHMELRLIHEEYAGEARVVYADRVPETSFPATFRLRLPVGWRPGQDSMSSLARHMQERHLGLTSVVLADGKSARFERTAAFARALRLGEGEDDLVLDDVVDEVAGTWWQAGDEIGFENPAQASAPRSTVTKSSVRVSDPVRTGPTWIHRPLGRLVRRAVRLLRGSRQRL
jgi:GT2 family glycosyltransferase